MQKDQKEMSEKNAKALLFGESEVKREEKKKEEEEKNQQAKLFLLFGKKGLECKQQYQGLVNKSPRESAIKPR